MLLALLFLITPELCEKTNCTDLAKQNHTIFGNCDTINVGGQNYSCAAEKTNTLNSQMIILFAVLFAIALLLFVSLCRIQCY